MKNYLPIIVFVSLFVFFADYAYGQCTNTSPYGSVTAPSTTTPLQISTCNYEDEYNTISGVVAGETYLSESDCGSYITVRSGSSSGTVVAYGWEPLTWTAVVSGTHYIHYNTSAGCGTASDCCTTTITCTSCGAAPDPCTAVIPIASCGAGNSQSYAGGGTGLWFTSSTNPCTYLTEGVEQIYSFTPSITSTYTIEVTAASGYVDYLWQANTCALAGWTCIDDINSTGSYGALSLTAGTTYYFLLDDEDNTAGTHTFYIGCPPCTPANLTVTQNCAGDNLSYDLIINVTAMIDASTVDILTGSTTHYSNVGVGSYTISGLTMGTTLTVVDHSDPTCEYVEMITMCNLCGAPSTPSDECSAAPLIDLSQPFQGSTDCAYTVSAENPAESCGVSLNNDSWITFIAGDTDVEMDYTVGDCEPISDGIQLNVFSGTCATLTEVPGSCVNPTGENTTGTWNFTGLTVGETYYIRIDGYAGDLCDYYFEPVSGVVITPPNDECPDATPLNCGDTDIASNILATAADAPSGCSGGGTPAEGVWYSFIGTGDEVTISTDNAGTNFDTEINIFTGPCTSLTCIGGDDDGGNGLTSSYTFTSTNGVEYFIYVDGNGSSLGQFEISLVCSNPTPCDADAGVWD